MAGASHSTAGTEDLSRRLCETIAGWRYEDLPASVVAMLKLFLVDTFGVIGGAADAPGVRPLDDRMARWASGSGSATSLVSRRRLSPPDAALVNGTAGHALDFDDQHDPARVHTNCVMLPTLLATAQDLGGCSGRDFLLALAVGAELHARLGLASHKSLGWGWHPTMTFGALAGALAAGKLMKLDTDGLVNALGMAFHQASGSAQSMRDGVLSKRIGAGFAARNATLAAFLAADGLTGTRRTLEGSAGLFALYERDAVDVDTLMGELGTRWHLLDYSLKPYPCCRATHTVIGLGLRCHAEGMKPDDIESLEIGLGEFNWIAVGIDYDPARDDIVHAQFNACYAFARALTDGVVDFDSFRRPGITDARIAALTARSHCVNDPGIDPPAIHPARVTLKLRSGETRKLVSDVMKGSPKDPMSRDDVLRKFRSCIAFGLDVRGSAADRLVDAIERLEQSDDAGADLIAAFPAPAGAPT